MLPSLSKQIRNLEEELGVQLLIRDRRHVALTEAGCVFRQEFEKILWDISQAVEKVRSTGEVKKEISIGVFQPISMHPLFNEMMHLLILKFPEYEIKIRLLKFQELRSAYERGQIHLIFLLHIIREHFFESKSVSLGEVKRGIIYEKDLMMGVIADRTRSRWGRFRPYLMFAPPFMAVFNILTFTVFPIKGTAKVLLCLITYIGAGMAYTALSITLNSIVNVVTRDSKARMAYVTYRSSAMSIISPLCYLPLQCR